LVVLSYWFLGDSNMPSRYEERSLNENDGLRYCGKHKIFYNELIGCQLCIPESRADGEGIHARQELQKCPECKQQSLTFDNTYQLYTCMNNACALTFSQKDITRKETGLATNEKGSDNQQRRSGRAVVGTQYFDAETGRWKNMKLKSKRLATGDLLSIAAVQGAIIVGLLGAIIGGVIWYYVTILTGWRIGFAAIGVGLLVGNGVVYGAGQKRAWKLQLIALVLALLGLVIGKYLLMQHYYSEAGWEGWMPLGLFFRTYFDSLTSGFNGILDLFFMALAMWYAYRVPSPWRARR
jgi:hypothetical protein